MAEGIIIIDKPVGWTSLDVCAKLRGILHTKKVGHAGTLDPMATGVLPVFVGRATRAVSFADGGDKEYLATLRLGLTTDTQDTEGTVLARRPVTVGAAEVEAALAAFTGEIAQIPPMYSAIKVNGQKLYDLARRGQTVERAPRHVTIYELTLLSALSQTDFALRVRCSKGTYVRTLCHDIGQALGCGGCMAALRRTEAAGFTLAQSHTMAEAEAAGEALLTPVDALFSACPAYTVSHPRVEALCRNGNPFRVREALAEGLYRVYAMDGTFLSLSRLQGGVMTAQKNFFGG